MGNWVTQRVQPVTLAYPSGFTHAASGSGAFSLQDAAPATMKDAQVQGAQLLLREQLDYELIARALKGRNAFRDSIGLVIENMQKSFRKRLEGMLWYGQSGIGTVASVASTTITITTAEFAPFIWAGSEGSVIEVFNGTTSRGTATITSVDIDARTVTVNSMPASTGAGDLLFFASANAGSSSFQECIGVHKILSATTGSPFNINIATYSLFRGTTQGIGSTVASFTGIRKGISKAVNKGLMEGLSLYVNPKTWDDLMTDLAALRRLPDSKYDKYTIGADSIEYYSQNGKTVIKPCGFVKEGYAYALPTDHWKRIGAVDIVFGDPMFKDDIFFHIPTKAGVEMRAYTSQAIFTDAPAKSILFSGIVNST